MADVRWQLLSGEKIMWEGRPFPGVVFRPIEMFLVPFSIVWGGFAVFWNASVWKTEADLSFKLFGLPFLIAGVYVTVGRFFNDMRIRKATTYYVTNKRVLVARGSKLKSLDIKRLPSLELDERRDGSGTIRFGTAAGLFSGANNFGIWQPTSDPTPQFIRVPHVRSLYELIPKRTDRFPEEFRAPAGVRKSWRPEPADCKRYAMGFSGLSLRSGVATRQVRGRPSMRTVGIEAAVTGLLVWMTGSAEGDGIGW